MSIYSVDENEQPHGKMTTYREDGTRESVQLYFHGVPNGIIQTFDSLGNITSSATMVNGELQGRMLTFYPSKHVLEIKNMANSKMNGTREFFFENGRLAWTGEMQNDSELCFVKFRDTVGRSIDRFKVGFTSDIPDTITKGASYAVQLNCAYNHYLDGFFQMRNVELNNYSGTVMLLADNSGYVLQSPANLPEGSYVLDIIFKAKPIFNCTRDEAFFGVKTVYLKSK